MAKDRIDQMLENEDKGTRTKGTLSEARQQTPSAPVVRPNGLFGIFTAPPTVPQPPKSQAPKGHECCVPDQIGDLRQMEAARVFRKGLGGRAISNPLRYRKPETGIDAQFGPGDKVSG